ncbi:MAG: lysophospholipase [Clostridia bacterium]|nr:lysophospholipase [Clostridia bacterium]
MSTQTIEKQVLSSDGVHTLKGIVYLPTGAPQGIFHLVHGMTEYIGRYEALLSLIATAGYVACGFDNLGHGKTASEDERGFIAEKDGYRLLVEDVKLFGDAVKQDYPDLPYFLMGHSMGSFIVRLTAEKYGNDIDKLIICGTGGPNPAAGAGLFLCRLLALFKGKRAYSDFIENMAFGTYNKKFPGGGKYEWLTKDDAIKAAYAADPLCTFRFTLSALYDLVKLNSLCNKPRWFKNMRRDLPILLISGKDDPVGNYGKGVNAVYEKLKKNGCNADIHLYENCRHEIHNDTCREQSAQDILKFIMK